MQAQHTQIPYKQQVNVADQIKESIINVSKSQKFQTKLMVFFLFMAFFIYFQYYSSQIFYMNPVFQCENYHYKVTEDQACKMLDFCKITNQQTIVAELNLYCNQQKDHRTLIQTTAGVGSWIGIFLAGAISDRKGRKFCFCIAFILLNVTCLFQFVGVSISSVPLLLLAEFIAGVCNKVIYLNFLVILTRFMNKQWYQAGTLGFFISASGIGLVIIAGINAYFQSWRALFYIQSFGIAACSVAALFILKEDPIYLFDVGKLEESKRIIQEVGQENGVDFHTNQENLKKIDLIFEMKMQQIQNNGQANKFKFNIKQIIRCDIITKIIVIGVIGCFYAMAVKSIQLSIQNLSNSFNFNLCIVGISNICGFTSAIYITRIETQRKRGLIYTSFIYGAIAFLFLFPFCYQNGNVQTLILFFLRLFLGWICNFYTRLKTDSFPQKYQITCMGMVEFLANSGNVFGPILIQKSADRHMNPIFAINLLRITLGTLPLLCLSQQKIILNTGENEQQLPFSPKKYDKLKQIAN